MIFELNETESTREDIKNLYLDNDARFCDAVYALSVTDETMPDGTKLCAPLGGVYLSMLLPGGDEASILRGAGVCACRAVKKVTGKDLRLRPEHELLMDGVCTGLISCGPVSGKREEGDLPDGLVLSVFMNIIPLMQTAPEGCSFIPGGLYPSAGDIGWIATARAKGSGGEDLSQLLIAGLRSQLMYALLEEFRSLTGEDSLPKLADLYEEFLDLSAAASAEIPEAKSAENA